MDELKRKIAQAEIDFRGSRYEQIVNEAVWLYLEGKRTLAEAKLNLLPSGKDLLERLLEKLKGKSVYTTLKKVSEGKAKNDWVQAKGLFSLGTHICIECEKGGLEYKRLLREVYEKITKELSRLM